MDNSGSASSTLAVNTTLPAFAAERRTAAPLLLGARRRRCRSIYPARTALSSKPAARRCCGSGSDRRTLDRFVAPAPHTMRVVSIKRVVLILRRLLFSTHYSALGKEAELRYACLSVSMSARKHISKTNCPNFTKFSMPVGYGRSLVLFWRSCNMVCTSGPQWLNYSARGGGSLQARGLKGQGPKLEPEGLKAEVGFPTADQI